MQLRPVTFHAKPQPDRPKQYGLIAEEAEEVTPRLVVRNATGEPGTPADHEPPAMPPNQLQKQPVQIEALAIWLAAIGAAVTVSVVFGHDPAWSASRLDPIEALHFQKWVTGSTASQHPIEKTSEFKTGLGEDGPCTRG